MTISATNAASVKGETRETEKFVPTLWIILMKNVRTMPSQKNGKRTMPTNKTGI